MGSEPAGARGRNNHLRMWITRHPIAYLTIGARVKSVQSDGTVGSRVRRRIGPTSGTSDEYHRAVADNRHTIGLPGLALSEIEAAGIVLPDLDAVRRYRLNRVRSRLQHLDYAGVIGYDPVHIRYASDTTNMSVWTSHNPYRYLWVAAEGPTILFDYKRADFLAGHTSVVDEVRPATLWMYAPSGTPGWIPIWHSGRPSWPVWSMNTEGATGGWRSTAPVPTPSMLSGTTDSSCAAATR